jgi:hypothetical protein
MKKLSFSPIFILDMTAAVRPLMPASVTFGPTTSAHSCRRARWPFGLHPSAPMARRESVTTACSLFARFGKEKKKGKKKKKKKEKKEREIKPLLATGKLGSSQKH